MELARRASYAYHRDSSPCGLNSEQPPHVGRRARIESLTMVVDKIDFAISQYEVKGYTK